MIAGAAIPAGPVRLIVPPEPGPGLGWIVVAVAGALVFMAGLVFGWRAFVAGRRSADPRARAIAALGSRLRLSRRQLTALAGACAAVGADVLAVLASDVRSNHLGTALVRHARRSGDVALAQAMRRLGLEVSITSPNRGRR